MIEDSFDIYIPIVKRVGVIKRMIIKVAEEYNDSAFAGKNYFRNLYDKVTGEMIDDNEFVKYSKIKNGSKLILY